MNANNSINSMNVINKVNNLNNLVKNLDFEGKDQYRYPTIYKSIQKYGAENIVYLGRDYYGKYEDDYCYFFYFNLVTNKRESDYWTTAAACPNFQMYEAPISRNEMNVINPQFDEIYTNFLREDECKKIDNRLSNDEVKNKLLKDLNGNFAYTLKANVVRGRKYKGECIVFGMHRQFNAYRHDYEIYALCYVQATNAIYEINPYYIEYNTQIADEFLNYCKELVKAKDSDIFAIQRMSEKELFEKFYKENCKNFEIPNNATNKAQEKRDLKFNKFKESKMIDLIDWVKNNTDKKGDEIQQLAEHIFNKRYA